MCMVCMSWIYYTILTEQILEHSVIPFHFVNYRAAPIQKFFWNSIPRHLAFVPGISTALENPALKAPFWEILSVLRSTFIECSI